MDSVQTRRAPARAEQIADAVVHIVGVATVMLAAPVLVTLAAVWRDEPAVIAAISIYAATLLIMILSSASYNLASMRLPGGRLLEVLRRIDHSAIYVKIAGTYTPFAVIAGGPFGRWLLVGVWAGAILGTLGKLFAPHRWERLSIALYLALGWAFIIAAGPISAALTTATLVLIIVGGCLYSVGVVFHVWDKLPYQNAIWHVFVLVASLVFYSAMIVEVAIGT
ncbi:MAG: hemolysin III family protein [Pseudomonadota bacterium]